MSGPRISRHHVSIRGFETKMESENTDVLCFLSSDLARFLIECSYFEESTSSRVLHCVSKP
jgi:hypothetical protein